MHALPWWLCILLHKNAWNGRRVGAFSFEHFGNGILGSHSFRPRVSNSVIQQQLQTSSFSKQNKSSSKGSHWFIPTLKQKQLQMFSFTQNAVADVLIVTGVMPTVKKQFHHPIFTKHWISFLQWYKSGSVCSHFHNQAKWKKKKKKEGFLGWKKKRKIGKELAVCTVIFGL